MKWLKARRSEGKIGKLKRGTEPLLRQTFVLVTYGYLPTWHAFLLLQDDKVSAEDEKEIIIDLGSYRCTVASIVGCGSCVCLKP